MALPFLIENGTATGTAQRLSAGVYTFAVDGTFSGATIALQMLGPDGSSYIAITGASFTAEGAINVELPSGSYKAVVTGGPPSGIYATIKQAGTPQR